MKRLFVNVAETYSTKTSFVFQVFVKSANIFGWQNSN